MDSGGTASGVGPTVFWSWQSDYDQKSCHYFVRDALNAAIGQMADAMSLAPADRPSLDHDTKGARGMADISATILEKIQRCSLFVADLTPIARTDGGKWVPNPNVMIELGWAMHSPGSEFIIPVLNLARGCTVEGLPFDIRGRRVVTYKLDLDASAGVRKAALRELTDLLRVVMEEELKRGAANFANLVPPNIEGVDSNLLDRSIWRIDSGLITHEEMGRPVSVSFPDEPRTYVRVIPAPMSGNKPNLSAFESLAIREKISSDSAGSAGSGSYGATENGFITYWMKGDSGAKEARNATMYFEDSGEIWSFSGGAFFRDDESRLIVNAPVVLRSAYRIIKSAVEIQDALGWPSARRIEVGFVTTETPYFHLSTKMMGRKKAWTFSETRRSWSVDDLDTYAIRMVESFFSVFGVAPPDPASAMNLLVIR